VKILKWLNEEIIKEYKAGNKIRRVFLQTIKAALLNRAKETGGEISDEDEIKVLKSELKQRQEALEQYRAGNRQDLVDSIQKEIDILKELLPAEMSEVEIEKIVREKIKTLEDKSFGSVMKAVMAELRGRADGKTVAQVVKKIVG
jgi:hypothetical protein